MSNTDNAASRGQGGKRQHAQRQCQNSRLTTRRLSSEHLTVSDRRTTAVDDLEVKDERNPRELQTASDAEAKARREADNIVGEFPELYKYTSKWT
ncbi:hypothetical protein E4U42_000286 [Claviceps africana]|uniref:Uncharacterized protein n=1 Tax=Claviceps africana TaxID=83212 RepID=A0A8K0JA40_9HYPO|nr:hypothetical protein E4U42_000286 [Claviceps africana]